MLCARPVVGPVQPYCATSPITLQMSTAEPCSPGFLEEFFSETHKAIRAKRAGVLTPAHDRCLADLLPVHHDSYLWLADRARVSRRLRPRVLSPLAGLGPVVPPAALSGVVLFGVVVPATLGLLGLREGSG